jgi:hypothetical protein
MSLMRLFLKTTDFDQPVAPQLMESADANAVHGRREKLQQTARQAVENFATFGATSPRFP